jgi:LAO/AO transport system kinase
MHAELPTSSLAEGVTRGNRRALARAITLLESDRVEDEAQQEALLAKLWPHVGGAARVGLSGAPGVGKSTLIDALGLAAVERGRKVAVLAVDPTSRRTGGSILGDKTRMTRLAAAEASFIRPSPSRSAEGGVAPRTREAITACEAAGFDWVLVETVGVGQIEIDVAEMVDCLVLVTAPGSGDEISGMKRGVLEHADIVVVNKADGPDRERAERARCDLLSALSLFAQTGEAPEVLSVSAVEGSGVLELASTIERWVEAARRTGAFESRRRAQMQAWFSSAVLEGLRRRFLRAPGVAVRERELAEAVLAGTLTPRRAAQDLIDSAVPAGARR